jgi:mono/diheme cytochrome c family protein
LHIKLLVGRTPWSAADALVGPHESSRHLQAADQRSAPPRHTRQLLLIVGAAFALAGCRQDMHDQPKYKPLGETGFFADKRQSRPLIANTVARGELHDGDSEFYTGKRMGKDGKPEDIDVFPIAITKDVIERGHERFDAFCSPCHGRLGDGMGMIVRRGFKQPPTYHQPKLRDAPVGHFYDVITNGYGAMYNYAAQIQPRDRWAIASYIRALQYSQNANAADLSAESRAKIPPATAPENTAPANTPPPAKKEGTN